jgi:hypothetical protein
MDIINAEKVKELARMKEPESLSIFIPTYRAGMETNEKIDQKHLKNMIKNARHELGSSGLKGRDIEELLKPVNNLVEDTGFWKLQSDGLAIFRNRKFFEYYTLPVLFEPCIHIADHFYPMPLIPYINNGIEFYLLAISMGKVKLYEGFPHNIHEIEINDLVPERLEEAVGFDFEQKHLNYRAGSDERGRAIYHGHGSASQEETKIEILKFFRAVNNGIMELLHDKDKPLVLATVDYLAPIYREANSYKYLHREFLAGNPEHENPVVLHEKVRDLLTDHFESDRKDKIRLFEQALSQQKAEYREEKVIPATINGRVDTLFIQKGKEMWGLYDSENNTVIERDMKASHNTSLLNLAAMHTLLNSGKVFILEPEDMPESSSRLNAILRY